MQPRAKLDENAVDKLIATLNAYKKSEIESEAVDLALDYLEFLKNIIADYEAKTSLSAYNEYSEDFLRLQNILEDSKFLFGNALQFLEFINSIKVFQKKMNKVIHNSFIPTDSVVLEGLSASSLTIQSADLDEHKDERAEAAPPAHNSSEPSLAEPVSPFLVTPSVRAPECASSSSLSSLASSDSSAGSSSSVSDEQDSLEVDVVSPVLTFADVSPESVSPTSALSDETGSKGSSSRLSLSLSPELTEGCEESDEQLLDPEMTEALQPQVSPHSAAPRLVILTLGDSHSESSDLLILSRFKEISPADDEPLAELLTQNKMHADTIDEVIARNTNIDSSVGTINVYQGISSREVLKSIRRAASINKLDIIDNDDLVNEEKELVLTIIRKYLAEHKNTYGEKRALELLMTISETNDQGSLSSIVIDFLKHGKTKIDSKKWSIFSSFSRSSNTETTSLRGMLMDSLVHEKSPKAWTRKKCVYAMMSSLKSNTFDDSFELRFTGVPKRMLVKDDSENKRIMATRAVY